MDDEEVKILVKLEEVLVEAKEKVRQTKMEYLKTLAKHGGDTAFFIHIGNGGLDGRGPSVFWQQGGMNINRVNFRDIQNSLG